MDINEFAINKVSPLTNINHLIFNFAITMALPKSLVPCQPANFVCSNNIHNHFMIAKSATKILTVCFYLEKIPRQLWGSQEKT